MNRQRSIAISLVALTLSACAQTGSYASAPTRLDATLLGFQSASLQSDNVAEKAEAVDLPASRRVRASTVRDAAIAALGGCDVAAKTAGSTLNCTGSAYSHAIGRAVTDQSTLGGADAQGPISARSTISLL